MRRIWHEIMRRIRLGHLRVRYFEVEFARRPRGEWPEEEDGWEKDDWAVNGWVNELYGVIPEDTDPHDIVTCAISLTGSSSGACTLTCAATGTTRQTRSATSSIATKTTISAGIRRSGEKKASGSQCAAGSSSGCNAQEARN